MDTISLLPDKKLRTKQFMVLGTISLFIILVALILQITIPLGKKTSSGQVAGVLWPICSAAIILIWIISTPLISLWIKNLKYIVETDRMNLHKGVLSKIQQNIPFWAITDFMLHRSLYDRFLGIASIRIQTAGQSQTPTGYEGNMAGLTNWTEIMEELRNRIKQGDQKSAGTRGISPKSGSSGEVFDEILLELKNIRKVLEEK